MRTIPRTVGLVLVGALTLLACGASNQDGTGVTNQQAPGTCLSRDTPCDKDADCCSLWCVNGECHQKQP
jgi:hypothetical protein